MSLTSGPLRRFLAYPALIFGILSGSVCAVLGLFGALQEIALVHTSIAVMLMSVILHYWLTRCPRSVQAKLWLSGALLASLLPVMTPTVLIVTGFTPLTARPEGIDTLAARFADDAQDVLKGLRTGATVLKFRDFQQAETPVLPQLAEVSRRLIKKVNVASLKMLGYPPESVTRYLSSSVALLAAPVGAEISVVILVNPDMVRRDLASPETGLIDQWGPTNGHIACLHSGSTILAASVSAGTYDVLEEPGFALLRELCSTAVKEKDNPEIRRRVLPGEKEV